MAIDFKKTEKEYYLPTTKPEIVEVPEMVFFMIDGKGDPNTSEDYAVAVQTLYGLSYAIRMNKKLPGYYEYVVPPLEGLWALDDGGEFTGSGEAVQDKSKFIWTMMIRQPEFVTTELFEEARQALAKKKPELDTAPARLEKFTEGLCVQVLHIGPYDDEPATVAAMAEFVAKNGYVEDMAGSRRHHEIYLSDPRKVAPEKLKTVIRHPIVKLG